MQEAVPFAKGLEEKGWQADYRADPFTAFKKRKVSGWLAFKDDDTSILSFNDS